MQNDEIKRIVAWFNERGLLSSDVNQSNVRAACLSLEIPSSDFLQPECLEKIRTEIQRVRVDLCF